MNGAKKKTLKFGDSSDNSESCDDSDGSDDFRPVKV